MLNKEMKNRTVIIYCLEKTKNRLEEYHNLTGIIMYRIVDSAINKYLDEIEKNSVSSDGRMAEKQKFEIVEN